MGTSHVASSKYIDWRGIWQEAIASSYVPGGEHIAGMI